MTNITKLADEMALDIKNIVSERDRLKKMLEDQTVELAMFKSRCQAYEERLTSCERTRDHYMRIATTLITSFDNCFTTFDNALKRAKAEMGVARPSVPQFSEEDQKQLEKAIQGVIKINTGVDSDGRRSA